MCEYAIVCDVRCAKLNRIREGKHAEAGGSGVNPERCWSQKSRYGTCRYWRWCIGPIENGLSWLTENLRHLRLQLFQFERLADQVHARTQEAFAGHGRFRVAGDQQHR